MDEKEKLKRELARQKATGYAAQKRYREKHPEKAREYRQKQTDREKGNIYEPRLRLPIEDKKILQQLCSQTGLTITQLCVIAIKEKYGVILCENNIDKTEK